jgi:hypothetical protein
MGVLKDLDLKSIANSATSQLRIGGYQHAWLCLLNSGNKANRVYDYSVGSTNKHAELWIVEPTRLAALVQNFTDTHHGVPDSFYIYSYYSPCDGCAIALTNAAGAYAHKALCFTKLWIDTQTSSGHGYHSAARAMQSLQPMLTAGFVIKQFPNPWTETNAPSNWVYPSSLI